MGAHGRRLQQGVAGNTGAKLYLTPVSGSYTVGNNVVLAVREDSLAAPVNGVQANLTYPASLLQFQSANNTGSGFTLMLQNTGGGGTVQLGVGLLGDSLTGDQLVGTITFTVLAAGSAQVSINSTSEVTSADDASNVCRRRFGARYTLS
ncbi:MAG: cohesin domain-containing protein [Candidatus Saccharimonadales bacterium]